MDRVDCAVFQDQLDTLERGPLPEEALAPFREHAAGCAECAALLRMREELVTPSLGELEAQVPDAWVASMYGEVRRELARREPERRGSGRTSARRWLVPTLAAATVTLLLANGLALRALRRAEVRADSLVEQVLDQQRRLVSLEDPTQERRGMVTAYAARSGPMRSLEGREDLTVGDLRAALQGVPGSTAVLSRSQASQLVRSRALPGPWRDALRRAGAGDEGVTARMLLGVLDDLALPEGTPVPTARLFELLS